MPPETSHDQAIERLIAADPHLAVAVARSGRPRPFRREPTFGTLVLLVLEQQVSLASAAAAYRRLQSRAEVSAAGIRRLDDTTLREVGFSRQKIRYVRALSDAAASGSLDLAALPSLPDEQVRAALTAIPGIGAWTADVFLLAALQRPDVWPVGDRALQVGTAEVLGLDEPPAPAALGEIGRRWRPFRSTAARLIWHDYLTRRGRAAPSA